MCRPGPSASWPAGLPSPVVWLSGQHIAIPTGPGSIPPAWADVPLRPANRLGRRASSGWAGLPCRPWLPPRLGPLGQRPGWAASSPSAPAGPFPALHLAGPDQEDLAWPGFLPRAALYQFRLGWIRAFRLGQAGNPLAQAGLSSW
jgi:hypothetical protein